MLSMRRACRPGWTTTRKQVALWRKHGGGGGRRTFEQAPARAFSTNNSNNTSHGNSSTRRSWCWWGVGIGGGVGLVAGATTTTTSGDDDDDEKSPSPLVLPDGLPKSCCSGGFACDVAATPTSPRQDAFTVRKGWWWGRQVDPSSHISPPSSALRGTVWVDGRNFHPTQCSSMDLELTPAQRALPQQLAQIVQGHGDAAASSSSSSSALVLDGRSLDSNTAPYLKGARLGQGKALCIVTPTSLKQAVDCLSAIVRADCVVIPQGSNTGLTGGSVPRATLSSLESGSENKARPVVILSMRRLNTIFPLDGGRRLVCMAGAGLADVSQFLNDYFPHYESHSVLGSTFLNPTVAAGVAFGSGGTQLRKGPATTERALYARMTRDKFGEWQLELINTLGLQGIEPTVDFAHFSRSNQSSMAALQALDAYRSDVDLGYRRAMGTSSRATPHGSAASSDVTYGSRVCRQAHGDSNDATTVSRYNADTRGLDCNRCEGKVLILATVHDTFPKPTQLQTYWISFDTLDTALAFRRRVCLDNAQDLPISVEYMNRDAFEVTDRSGRWLAHFIAFFGPTSRVVGQLWTLKIRLESLPGCDGLCDAWLHRLNSLVPPVLPRQIMDMAQTHSHHVAMTVGNFDNNDASSSSNSNNDSIARVEQRMEAFVQEYTADKVRVQKCSAQDLKSITAFRFVAAPAFRTWCVGSKAQGISVDYALPLAKGQEPNLALADKIGGSGSGGRQEQQPLKRMRYSHFGCNVVHEDLAFAKGVNVEKEKLALKRVVEEQEGGRLPAEHGHGVEYVAPPETQQRWKRMDPYNVMNPGIGGLSPHYKYR